MGVLEVTGQTFYTVPTSLRVRGCRYFTRRELVRPQPTFIEGHVDCPSHNFWISLRLDVELGPVMRVHSLVYHSLDWCSRVSTGGSREQESAGFGLSTMARRAVR